MAREGVRSSFDLLPAEVLDIIVEKVRSSCGESFQALGATSRELRDSARRCTKTLVVTPSKEIEQRAVMEACEDNSSLSMHLNEVLEEEIKKRPSLSELVMREPEFVKRGGRFSILASLSSISWTKCTLLGHACDPRHGHQFVAWDGSFCKRALSGSKESLQKLSIVCFDFEGLTLLKLGQQFSNLAALKVEGKIYKNCAPCKLPGHEKLLKLDISKFELFQKYPLEYARMSTGGMAPRRQVPALTAAGIWPPNITHLTVAAFCNEEPNGKILICTPLEGLSSFPCNLEVLEIDWKTFDHIRGSWARRCSLYSLLAASKCPLLRKIHVRATSGVAVTGLFPEAICQWFGAEIKKIFDCSPQLEELRFSGCDGEKIVSWEKSRHGVRIVCYQRYR